MKKISTIFLLLLFVLNGNWVVFAKANQEFSKEDILSDVPNYQRFTTRSGLVDIEKIGCSIDAISPLGVASKISQIKKSPCCMRSGRRGDFSLESSPMTLIFRVIAHLRRYIVLLPTSQAYFVLLHTNNRVITHQ